MTREDRAAALYDSRVDPLVARAASEAIAFVDQCLREGFRPDPARVMAWSVDAVAPGLDQAGKDKLAGKAAQAIQEALRLDRSVAAAPGRVG